MSLNADEICRKNVLSALRGPVMPRMTFGVGALFVIATDYMDVARAIEAGKITVKENPDLGHTAQYSPGSNLMEVTQWSSPSLIVHECTHAIFDVRKITTRVEQSEGFAYLAQEMYEWMTRRGPPSSRYMVSPDPWDVISWAGWQIIFDEATRLAGKLVTSSWIDESDAQDLYVGIRASSFYRGRAGKVETNDGI